MAFGVLDIEFPISIDQPDRARRNFFAMNVIGHIDVQTRAILGRKRN